MSDMLQLVVKIHYTQSTILLVAYTLRIPNPDDKLKHVGHLGHYSILLIDIARTRTETIYQRRYSSRASAYSER